jgi:hypothetical protein
MDPTANLAMQRALAKQILNDEGHSVIDAVALAEHVEALDDWVSGGGFLPTQWPAPAPTVQEGVQGAIRLADGSLSVFTIGLTGEWQQWGAYRERLGRTVDFMEALSNIVREHLNEGEES